MDLAILIFTDGFGPNGPVETTPNHFSKADNRSLELTVLIYIP